MTYEEIVALVKKGVAKADVSKAEPFAVQIDIKGEGEGAFYVALKDGELKVEPFEYYDHDAKIDVTGEDLKDIVSGKINLVDAFNEGKAYAVGDVSKLAVVADLFKKAPAKKAPAKKAPAKKEEAPKAEVKKAPAKKAPAKKEETVKAEVKKEEASKAETKKAPAKKAPAKKEETVKAEVKKEEAPKAETKKAPAKKTAKK